MEENKHDQSGCEKACRLRHCWTRDCNRSHCRTAYDTPEPTSFNRDTSGIYPRRSVDICLSCETWYYCHYDTPCGDHHILCCTQDCVYYTDLRLGLFVVR